MRLRKADGMVNEGLRGRRDGTCAAYPRPIVRVVVSFASTPRERPAGDQWRGEPVCGEVAFPMGSGVGPSRRAIKRRCWLCPKTRPPERLSLHIQIHPRRLPLRGPLKTGGREAVRRTNLSKASFATCCLRRNCSFAAQDTRQVPRESVAHVLNHCSRRLFSRSGHSALAHCGAGPVSASGA